jgi:4-hydroxybenzoate decarboxylase
MDLRTFIQQLEDQKELIRVKREVDPRFEAAAVISKVCKDLDKATLLERIKGNPMPIAGQVLGSYKRLASYFGFDKARIISELGKRWGQKKFQVTDGRQMPRKTIASVDLTKDLPIVTHSEKDGGPYITAGVVLAKDPHSDVYNLSYHRMQLIGPRELRVRIGSGHHLETYFNRAEKEGKNLEIAILIGASPAVMVAGAASLPLDSDELELAGALLNEPLAMTQAESVNLLVPCDTEIIIEGELLANQRRTEGPFGDWMENYIPVAENHVFQAKAVTYRENPIYYTMLASSPEDIVLIGFSAALSILKDVEKVVPSVIDVACWPFPFHVIIKIDKQFEGQGKQAALAAIGSSMHWVKFVTVVDADVDIYSSRDIAWAMGSRCCPDKDVFTIPNVPSFYRDPHRMHWGRVAIDATAPLKRKGEYERKRIPGEAEMDLKKYLT